MCGRFDTSHLTWTEIYEQLSQFGEVVTAPVNLQPDDDVRPTTAQLVARQEEGRWVLEKMRWGLLPFWRGGKPLKDTEKGKGDSFKLTPSTPGPKQWPAPRPSGAPLPAAAA